MTHIQEDEPGTVSQKAAFRKVGSLALGAGSVQHGTIASRSSLELTFQKKRAAKFVRSPKGKKLIP